MNAEIGRAEKKEFFFCEYHCECSEKQARTDLIFLRHYDSLIFILFPYFFRFCFVVEVC